MENCTKDCLNCANSFSEPASADNMPDVLHCMLHDGEVVDEEQDYAHYLNGHESDCYSAAESMSEQFSKDNFTTELSALQNAYEEYKRLVEIVN